MRRSVTRLKSVVKKPDPPAALTVYPATQEPSPIKKDWDKRSQKECFAACDKEKARSIVAADKEYAKLMEER